MFEDRFWALVDKRDPSECWPWLGAKDSNGRAQFRVDLKGAPTTAARIAWSLANRKPFPEDMDACHSCDEPWCVNPGHIWPGTRLENMRDAVKKRRMFHQKKTHCKNGHEFTKEDTRFDESGQRHCRVCQRECSRRRYRERKISDPEFSAQHRQRVKNWRLRQRSVIPMSTSDSGAL
jgi:hypothetical protein